MSITKPCRSDHPCARLSLLGTSGLALAIAAQLGAIAPAHAQEVPLPGQPSAAAQAALADGAPVTPEEITVTGSRIVRNGYDMPTPITVIGQQDIQASAPANVADFVNQLPSVAGSMTPATSNRQLSGGQAGVNTVNLRNLGANRTLVLIDGHRSVSSLSTGVVDVNTIPQGLVKSVEVVTGGASSVYGSDAVAGVVNFILDRDYTGLKGDVSYGQTTYDDDKTYKVSLTGGMPFAGGRGHILFSGQLTQRDGVNGVPRPWGLNGMYLTQNPAYVAGNGQPEYLPTTKAGLNTMTGGGIITAGPARGVYFGNGGTINRYDYGTNRLGNSTWTTGGDWLLSQHLYGTSLQPAEKMRNIFGRASYDITDNIQLWVEASYNWSRGTNWGGVISDKANITIRGDNAFIPAALLAQYPAIATTGFTLGSFNADLPTRISDNTRKVQRYVLGLEGSFDLLNTDWKWDGYYQKGITQAHISLSSVNRTKIGYSQDAVFDASGKIVCRVTRDGSTDPLAAGCVPYNRMGIGVNSQAAVDYVMGNPWRNERLEQDVAALNLSTNIANPWLKPIGLAFGVEHRREAISGYAPPEAASGWYVGNFLATNGSYDVTEGYVETLVALPFKLEFNGAARMTSYSTAGNVVTWKAGLTWNPVSDLRLRLVRSRDIRAPNLSELYEEGSRTTNSLTDPWLNTTKRYTQTVIGNLGLTPEKADTWSLGLVYRPSFLPGFGISIDYFDIKIKDAIASIGPQPTIDRCAAGVEDLCQRLTAVMGDGPTATQVAYGNGWSYASGPGAGVTEWLITNSPFNYVQQRARGLDFEVSYQTPLSEIAENLPGRLTLRGLATWSLERSSLNGIDPQTDSVGQNSGDGPATWRYRVTANYTLDDWTFQLTGRGLSAGVYNNDYVQCTASCPASTALHRTISDNHLPGAFYIDTYLARNLPIGNVNTELYFQITNLFNKDPARVGGGPSDTSDVEPGINRSLYDYLGRTFRVGLRFNLGG